MKKRFKKPDEKPSRKTSVFTGTSVISAFEVPPQNCC